MPAALKYAIIFVLVSIFACFLYYTTYAPFKACDDAYIYFVYAKNFVNGHGFVYNPGGERVEGFTSMLWMWVVILFYTISREHFWLLLFGFNCVMVSYALYRLTAFIDRIYLRGRYKGLSYLSIFLIFALFVIKGFADWTIFSLLEMGLWSTLLILIGVFLMEIATGVVKNGRGMYEFCLLLALLVLTRPESTLWGICFIGIYGYLYFLRGDRSGVLVKRLVAPTGTFFVTLIALTSFRLYYFGYPLSNTYYAKVSSDRVANIKEGIAYIAKFLFIYPVYYLSIVAALLLLIYFAKKFLSFKRTAQPFETALYVNAIIIGISLLVPLVNGGDHFSLFRLFQPVVPFFLLLFFNPYLWKIPANVRLPFISWYALGVILLIPFVYLINMPKYLANVDKTPYRFSLLPEFSGAEKNMNESLWLNKFLDFNPRPSIGRVWAGAYAFTYEGNTVDLMGLNNTLMAHALPVKKGTKNHAAFDIKTFFKLKPDLFGGQSVADTSGFIMPENTPDFKESFENQIFKGMYLDPTFIDLYRPALITNPSYKESYFSYVRKDYIDTLRQHNMGVNLLTRTKSNL